MKKLLEPLDMVWSQGRREPDHELPVDIPHAMVAAVKTVDMLDCSVTGVDPLEEREIRRTDISPCEHFFLEEPYPCCPVRTPRLVHEHERQGIALSRLDERQRFHGLVERAEAAGEERHGISFLEKGHLAVEEVFVRDEARVALEHGVWLLLEGETDVHAERMLRSGAFVHGLHDAAPAAGDDHVAGFGEFRAEIASHRVYRLIALRPRRAEDRDLAHVPVGAEDLRREPHLLESGVHELEVCALVVFLASLECGYDHFADVFRTADAVGIIY